MQGLLSNFFIVVLTLSKWISSFVFFLLFTVPVAEAIPPFQKQKQYSDPTHFKLTAIVDPQSVKPGSRFTLYIKVELSAGWHIYSLYSKGVEKQIMPNFFENSYNSINSSFENSRACLCSR